MIEFPDTSHVLPPNPENFWPFAPGQTRVLAIDPLLTFCVNEILAGWIRATEVLGAETVHGILELHRPVVIAQSQGEPMVTLTLRKIENGKAYIQVSASPAMGQGRRQ